MSRWGKVELRKICTVNMGQSPNSSTYNQDGYGIPFYQGNADFGELHPKPRYYCTKPAKLAQRGDILISVRAPIGDLNIATSTCCIGRGLAALTAFEDITYPKYLYYLLRAKNKELNQKGTGSTFKAISKQTLSKILCPLPPLEIQKHIAKTLDTAAELLALRKQQLAELDNLAKSIFCDMFGDPVTNEKGWEIRSLRDVCTKITDGTHHSPSNFSTGQYKYITAKNIKKDGFDFTNLTYVSEAIHREIFSRCNPEFGDILYIKDGITTGIAQINTLNEEFSLLSSVALLKQNREIISAYYLRDVLNNETMYENIRKNMGGAAITRLTIKKIQAIKIPHPPMSLQTKYAEIVIKIEDQKDLVKKAIDETQYLFDCLMSEYFN